MVSVPCVMTKPSYASYTSRTRRAICTQCSGRILVLSRLHTCSAVTSQTSAISGTHPSSSSAVSAGVSPSPRFRDAIVPPVAKSNIFFTLPHFRPFRFVSCAPGAALFPAHRSGERGTDAAFGGCARLRVSRAAAGNGARCRPLAGDRLPSFSPLV